MADILSRLQCVDNINIHGSRFVVFCLGFANDLVSHILQIYYINIYTSLFPPFLMSIYKIETKNVNESLTNTIHEYIH